MRRLTEKKKRIERILFQVSGCIVGANEIISLRDILSGLLHFGAGEDFSNLVKYE